MVDPTAEEAGEVNEDSTVPLRDVSEALRSPRAPQQPSRAPVPSSDSPGPIRTMFPTSRLPQPLDHEDNVLLGFRRIDTAERVISAAKQNRNLRLAFAQHLLDPPAHIGGRVARNPKIHGPVALAATMRSQTSQGSVIAGARSVWLSPIATNNGRRP